MNEPVLKKPLRKALLTARVLAEREQLRQDVSVLGHSLSPDAIKTALLDAGGETLMSFTRRRSGFFSLIEKNPLVSLTIARFLLRAAKSRSALIKPIALAATSWFVYNKFQSKQTSRRQAPSRSKSEQDLPVDHGTFTYQDQDPATEHRP
ncbi:MAG: hypothetical protein ACTIKR_14155 [Advenella sp.]|uniref:Uncharacterized protein n=1 Tax=Advenella kashmirensis TaxID=310575 RepID=A0A356LDY2_9BURK|nr:hypothetical protein [Advenella sp. FME57]HBP29203.1 hypothetical protein [Advenella kashmirensis]